MANSLDTEIMVLGWEVGWWGSGLWVAYNNMSSWSPSLLEMEAAVTKLTLPRKFSSINYYGCLIDDKGKVNFGFRQIIIGYNSSGTLTVPYQSLMKWYKPLSAK